MLCCMQHTCSSSIPELSPAVTEPTLLVNNAPDADSYAADLAAQQDDCHGRTGAPCVHQSRTLGVDSCFARRHPASSLLCGLHYGAVPVSLREVGGRCSTVCARQLLLQQVRVWMQMGVAGSPCCCHQSPCQARHSFMCHHQQQPSLTVCGALSDGSPMPNCRSLTSSCWLPSIALPCEACSAHLTSTITAV